MPDNSDKINLKQLDKTTEPKVKESVAAGALATLLLWAYNNWQIGVYEVCLQQSMNDSQCTDWHLGEPLYGFAVTAFCSIVGPIMRKWNKIASNGNRKTDEFNEIKKDIKILSLAVERLIKQNEQTEEKST